MPITRAKASQLLNQREMALYDDSRINGLRQLDDKALTARVTRARTARDRARDLVRRQKLASRERTGSKRGASGSANQRSKDKAELLADILDRFETRLREVEGAAARTRKSAPARKSGGGAASKAARTTSASAARNSRTVKSAKSAKTTKSAKSARTAGTPKAAKTAKTKSAAKTAQTARTSEPARRATAAGKPTRLTAASPTSRAAPATAKTARKSASAAPADGARPSARGGARKQDGASEGRSPSAKAPQDGARRRPRKRRITPEEALAQTQTLLEAKHARDSEPKPWEDIGGTGPAAGEPGYQSAGAERRARRLHAAEIRLPATQGSISTRDRVNQGKRDQRGQADD